MPLLLYYIAPDEAPSAPGPGIGGAPMRSTESDGLRCFYSEWDNPVADVKASALQFHAVVQQALQSGPVIPFRFPTIVGGLEELRRAVEERSPQFRRHLQLHAGHLQMEVRLSAASSVAAPQSGTDYLRARLRTSHLLEAAVETCRSTPLVLDARTRVGSEGVRCYFLVKRADAEPFRSYMRSVPLPEGVTAVVSGPWAPTEFLEDRHA